MIYTDNEMASFDATVEKQMHFSFSARRDSAKKAASTAHASRSSVLDLDHDLGAHTVSTTDFRDLSRYLMEDLVRSAAGNRFLVCVDKQADFAGVPARIALHQRKEKVGRELVRISGRVYFTLAGTLTLANSNQSVQLGMICGQFLREYTSHGAGFGLSFDASPDTLTFSWQDIVEQPLDVIFFGRKFEGGRPYSKELFCFKSDPKYAHHVFRQFAHELWGDSLAVSQLWGAYQKRLRVTYENKFLESEASKAGL